MIASMCEKEIGVHALGTASVYRSIKSYDGTPLKFWSWVEVKVNQEYLGKVKHTAEEFEEIEDEEAKARLELQALFSRRGRKVLRNRVVETEREQAKKVQAEMNRLSKVRKQRAEENAGSQLDLTWAVDEDADLQKQAKRATRLQYLINLVYFGPQVSAHSRIVGVVVVLILNLSNDFGPPPPPPPPPGGRL